MYPLPDLSFFAIKRFLDEIYKTSVISSSLFLNNGRFNTWNTALSDSDSELYTWLHNTTNVYHNIYMPFTLNRRFEDDYSYHIREIVRVVKPRIHSLLKTVGIEDPDQFMQDSNDWLALLFAKPRDHFAASEIATTAFGLATQDLPMIVIWNNPDSKRIINIVPSHNTADVTEHIKKIYTSIINPCKTSHVAQKKAKIEWLNERINIEMESLFAEDKSAKPAVYLKNLENTVINTLQVMGQEYHKRFEECILSFEEQVKQKDPQEDIVSFCERTQKELTKELLSAGFSLIRDTGPHQTWQNGASKVQVELPRHRKISPGVARNVYDAIKQSRFATESR